MATNTTRSGGTRRAIKFLYLRIAEIMMSAVIIIIILNKFSFGAHDAVKVRTLTHTHKQKQKHEIKQLTKASEINISNRSEYSGL